MTHTGSGPVDLTGESMERPTFVGLVAAAVWLVGLAVGVFALVAGHLAVAAVSVVLALVAPWWGLAWNRHARLRAEDVKVSFPGSGPLAAR
jgi:Flp pilus assembly protein TadB